jgi:hypothetical protein
VRKLLLDGTGRRKQAAHGLVRTQGFPECRRGTFCLQSWSSLQSVPVHRTHVACRRSDAHPLIVLLPLVHGGSAAKWPASSPMKSRSQTAEALLEWAEKSRFYATGRQISEPRRRSNPLTYATAKTLHHLFEPRSTYHATRSTGDRCAHFEI